MMETISFLILLSSLFITVEVDAHDRHYEPPLRYFGTTKDLTLDVTPATVYDGFTRDLTISCMFSRRELSDFDHLLSLILSKADDGLDRYSELATITSVASNIVEIKQSLGGDVTGMIRPNMASFITYKWAWPRNDVAGRYFCEAHGWNVKGHARMSTATGEVVIKTTLDMGSVNKTMRELDSHLATCSANKTLQSKKIEILEASEEDMKKQLHDSNLEKEKTNAKIEMLESSEEGLKKHLNESMFTVKNMNAKVDMLEASVEEMKKQLNKTSLEAENMKSKLEILDSSEEELKRQLNQCSITSKRMASIVKDSVLIPGTSWRGHSYLLSKSVPVDILAANYFCLQIGGYLIEIDDEDEYGFVVNLTNQLIDGSKSKYGVAIGTWDEGHEGNWTFMRSEKSMTYLKWDTNEPNNSRGGENCMVIGHTSKKFNDLGCTMPNYNINFLCEIPKTLDT